MRRGYRRLFCCVVIVFFLVIFRGKNMKFFKFRSLPSPSNLNARVVLCTSTMGRYYNDMLLKSRNIPKDKLMAARLGHYNLLSKESLSISTKYPMRIYTEDSYDVSSGRPSVKKELLENVEYIDIFKVYDWLGSFVTNKSNSVYKFHQAARIFFGLTRTTEQTDLGLFRKILAILDTLKNTPDGTIVLWLDLDTYFMSEFSETAIKYFLGADVTYIPSFTSVECLHDFPFRKNEDKKYLCGLCADTGILAYVSGDRTRMVLKEQVNWILHGATQYQSYCANRKLNTPECLAGMKYGICNPLVSLNDIAVFGKSMTDSLHNISQQFLSTGCLRQDDGNWVQNAQMYKTTRTVLCPENSSMLPTSNFNILEFVMHFRGTSSGLAKRRAIWDKGVAKPKTSFMKSMRKNGASAQKLQKIV